MLIIDAKSGTSGAGRGSKVDSLYCEVNENIKAYGVASHRHTPEIEEQLSCAAGKPVTISFTPHLVPMNRGILVTAYASLTKKLSYEEVKAVSYTHLAVRTQEAVYLAVFHPETQMVHCQMAAVIFHKDVYKRQGNG